MADIFNCVAELCHNCIPMPVVPLIMKGPCLLEDSVATNPTCDFTFATDPVMVVL
jgi:hypothetical protein